MPWRISDLYISLLVFITFIVSKLKEKNNNNNKKKTKTNEREIKNKIWKQFFYCCLLNKVTNIDVANFASIQGAIVTESIIICIFSDWKFIDELDSNIHSLVHSLFSALFELLCTHVPVYVLFSLYDYPNKFNFTK